MNMVVCKGSNWWGTTSTCKKKKDEKIRKLVCERGPLYIILLKKEISGKSRIFPWKWKIYGIGLLYSWKNFFKGDDLFDFHVFMITLEENSLGALWFFWNF